MRETTKNNIIMKRVIDLLTVATLGLTILATLWSVESFGQVTQSRKVNVVQLELEKDVLDFMKNEWTKVDVLMGEVQAELKQQIEKRFVRKTGESNVESEISARTLPTVEVEEKVDCGTFRFLGETYFQDPDAYYVDSCQVKRNVPENSFEFMGDYYPNMPQEDVEFNITY